MTLERITAVSGAAPVRGVADTRPRSPSYGEIVELTLNEVSAGELLATTAQGVSLKLAGFGSLGGQLVVGDMLLVKVVSTAPRLELMLFDTAARITTPIADDEQAAMRPDQVAWLRQQVRHAPDAASQGSAWRVALLAQLEHRLAQRAEAGSPQTANALWRAEAGMAPPHDDPNFSPPPGLDPWLLAAYAWGGRRVMLRVLSTDADGAEPPVPPRPWRTATALRVTLAMPGHGLVSALLQLYGDDGVLIDLSVEGADALQPVRDRLPALVAGLASASLRVVRCRLMRGLRPGAGGAGDAVLIGTSVVDGPGPGWAVQPQIPLAEALPPALFHAAAEVVRVLCAPVDPVTTTASPWPASAAAPAQATRPALRAPAWSDTLR